MPISKWIPARQTYILALWQIIKEVYPDYKLPNKANTPRFIVLSMVLTINFTF